MIPFLTCWSLGSRSPKWLGSRLKYGGNLAISFRGSFWASDMGFWYTELLILSASDTLSFWYGVIPWGGKTSFGGKSITLDLFYLGIHSITLPVPGWQRSNVIDLPACDVLFLSGMMPKWGLGFGFCCWRIVHQEQSDCTCWTITSFNPANVATLFMQILFQHWGGGWHRL